MWPSDLSFPCTCRVVTQSAPTLSPTLWISQATTSLAWSIASSHPDVGKAWQLGLVAQKSLIPRRLFNSFWFDPCKGHVRSRLLLQARYQPSS